MTRRVRLLGAAIAVVGLIAAKSFAFAPPDDKEQHFKRQAQGGPPEGRKQHQDYWGQALLGDNVKNDGSHQLQDHGKYSVSVYVSDGTITGFYVKLADKGSVPVTKYKAAKKARAATTGVQLASYLPAQAQDPDTMLIGYGYIDDWREEHIYWFPYDMIEDGDQDAIEYYTAN